MKVTFLEAKMALAKQFDVFDEQLNQITDKAYPKAANFITHTHEVGSIDEYHEALSSAAKNWYALLKGTANRENKDYADRKNLTDRNERTELMVLDVDGLQWDMPKRDNLTSSDVESAATKLIKMLPPTFHHCSYVAVASSNFGRKAGLRMHLHFLLNTPIATDVLRGLITALNFDVEYINKSLTLTPSGRQIKYPIDPCLADNSRIAYIAPPIFGDMTKNPFKSDADRIVKVIRGEERLDLTPLIENFSTAELMKTKEKRLRILMAEAGLEYVKPKTVTVNHRGVTVKVLQNPEQMSMKLAEISNDYIRYNINDGDSNAYWVWMDNPEIVYSFKPDEMPFRFRAADPEAYEAHMEMFGKQIEKAAAKETPEGDKILPMLIFDRDLDALVTVEYDPFCDIVRSARVNRKENAENWMRALGAMIPEPIPPYSVIFNPTSNVGHDQKAKTLNTYVPSRLVQSAPQFEGDPLAYGDAESWMRVHTPLISTIISNMVGDDLLCYEHFINWFAFMVQRREKPETAWVVHGVEGTGKGIFIKRIAKPILGANYVSEKKLRDISEDKYNGYMEEALLLFIDEFNMNESSNAKATANMLKNQITEPTLSIRKMQQNPVPRLTYFGMMFASNDIDSMRISPTDRRYNVCPRQETPLKVVIPDINLRRAHYDMEIEKELPTLMSMLLAYTVSEHNVRTPLENEAKIVAAEAGQTTDETFFLAFRRGDIEFFEPLATLKIVAGLDLGRAHHNRNIALEWLKDSLIEGRSRVLKQDLKTVYEYMTGFTVNDISFGRKCKQNGLYETRFRGSGARSRGFEVEWKPWDVNEIKEILEGSVSTAADDTNVVNLKA